MSVDPKNVVKIGYVEVIGAALSEHNSNSSLSSNRKGEALDKIFQKIVYMSFESVEDIGRTKRTGSVLSG